MSGQSGWRWCHKCQGAFFAGNPGQGVCPADRAAHDGSQSGNYAVLFEGTVPGFPPPQDLQGGWRWCLKCQGLFYAGNPQQGVCPADSSTHDGSQSGHYDALVGDGTALLPVLPILVTLGQAGWGWCYKCQGMFFTGGAAQAGSCPADPRDFGLPVTDQAHDASQGGAYAMMWDFPKPTSRTFDSGWLTSGLPLGGFTQIVMNEQGDYDFRSHAHDSGFDNIDYTVSAVIMTPDAYAFIFQHSGSTQGTVAGLPFGTPNRDDDFDNGTVNNPVLTSHWDGILQAQISARIDGSDTIVKGIEGVLGDMVKAALAQLGQAAAKGIIALL